MFRNQTIGISHLYAQVNTSLVTTSTYNVGLAARPAGQRERRQQDTLTGTACTRNRSNTRFKQHCCSFNDNKILNVKFANHVIDQTD
jgi:hypothetical protein